MVGFGIYMICVGLVVMGALGISRAFAAPGRWRMVFSSLAAAVPILIGIWLFRSFSLQVGDFHRLALGAAEEVRQLLGAVQRAQQLRTEDNARMDPEVRAELQKLLEK